MFGKNSDKPKDYRKLSMIKSIIFLVLAVIIMAGIYLNEKRPFENDGSTAGYGTSSSLSVTDEERTVYSDDGPVCYTEDR